MFYVVGFVCFITGHFKLFLIFTSIILFHECGHILAGVFLKWNIEKIIILPFGGITIFNDSLNKPLKEEFIIAIMGPIFQIIYFLLVNDPTFRTLNLTILIFNLLPIIPLDGAKILNILLNDFFSFKKSHILTIYFSLLILLFLILIIILKFNLLFLLILFFLLLEIIREYGKHEYYFDKFLLERYLNKFNFKKTKTIKNVKNMHKDCKHIFKLNNNYYTEHEILKKMFDK